MNILKPGKDRKRDKLLKMQRIFLDQRRNR